MRAEATHSLEAVSSMENNWGEDDVEKNLRVKCSLEINFILLHLDSSPEAVGIGLVGEILGIGIGVIELPWKLEPQRIWRQALIVHGIDFRIHTQVDQGCCCAGISNNCANNQPWDQQQTESFTPQVGRFLQGHLP